MLFLCSKSHCGPHLTHTKWQIIYPDPLYPLPYNQLSLTCSFLIISHSVSTEVSFLRFSQTLQAYSCFRASCIKLEVSSTEKFILDIDNLFTNLFRSLLKYHLFLMWSKLNPLPKMTTNHLSCSWLLPWFICLLHTFHYLACLFCRPHSR